MAPSLTQRPGEAYRPASGSIPDQPGVYRFSDADGRVIYVGKARSLRSRLNSYFADPASMLSRTRSMVATAAKVDWTVVQTEVEALQLEYSWIRIRPPVQHQVPRRQVLSLAGGHPLRGVPPGDGGAGTPAQGHPLLRPVLARLGDPGNRRPAAPGLPDAFLPAWCLQDHKQLGRPCLLGYIGKCSAPCIGRVDEAEHRAIVDDFCQFVGGQAAPMIKRLEREMRTASDAQEYERAARLRDDIGALQRAMEQNAVVFRDGTDADVIALAEDPLEVAVQIFHVRGRADPRPARLGRRTLRRLGYRRADRTIPAPAVRRGRPHDHGPGRGAWEILVPVLPSSAESLTRMLTERRGSRWPSGCRNAGTSGR